MIHHVADVYSFSPSLSISPSLSSSPSQTETLNPFENDNVQLFAACGLDSKQLNDIDLASLTSSTTEDPLQELSDLRRQVVYLQVFARSFRISCLASRQAQL